MTNKEWQTRLAGLVVFRPLGQDPVFAALEQLIGLLGQKPEQPAVLSRAVAQMEGELFAHTTDLSAYLSAAVLEAETICVRRAAQVRCLRYCRRLWTGSWRCCRRPAA